MINTPSQLVPLLQQTDELIAILFRSSVVTAKRNNVR
jgi:hypothetical protein